MFVTYKPETADGDPQRWEFDPGRVRASEAEMIEKRYGDKWDQWRNDVRAGSAKARRVLLWHLLRQAHHTLRYEDVPDFLMDELLVEHSVGELVELRDRLMKANVSDTDREQLMTALNIEITEAAERELTDPETVGKAPSNPDA